MNTRKGFTLVELLVVIAILAILATVSVVGYTSYIDGAETTAATTEAASIHDAITVALVNDKYIMVEKTAKVDANPDATPSVAAAAATYIYIVRDGNGYKAYDGYANYKAAVEAASGTAVAETSFKLVSTDVISKDLTHRLSVVDNVLTYTSEKGKAVPVK